ncbi:ABC transporter ATP-binding protein [Vulgatibacter incomptus]|uniref:ABC transporter ATP-binding protein n=1 Tax=Vulgatibacter incomptus TaxID=1391653 RepID=A0A0K1P9Y3_9BACT|nr:ABC transporter ATP-binding protein [Vulgatibacter incomptus]AKU90312.1 ABC transporter ATP-binding protein [Vulgatibacter incomptus]
MPDEILVTRGLTKVFHLGLRRRRVVAVQGLDLSVERGEIYGFLGPNGAGKSTTIKMLMGLITPTSGEASIFGQPIGATRARAHLGFLPENPYFHDFLTPEQLLAFAGRLGGLSSSTLAERIPRLLDLVGLGKARKMPLRRFSKGMVQRAGIAQALVGDPALVVLDEPMSGLDPIGRKDVREVIFRLKEEGKTVFFSSHILPDVEAICDRVGLMLHGRLREQGRLDELLTARARAVDVIAEAIPASLAASFRERAMRSLPKGNGWALTFSEEAEADEAVRALVLGGARIVSVARHRETLEDLFMRKADEAGAAHARGEESASA